MRNNPEVSQRQMPTEFTEGLHNAAQDIKILSTLIDKINVPNDKIISMAKSTPFILADRALKKYFKGAVTSVIASKIALGRINLTTLKKAFQLGGYDSVEMLLAENINNKPRVTKNEKTIKAIVDRLAWDTLDEADVTASGVRLVRIGRQAIKD
ncbi:hypothetical protein ILUMI_13939 [Ignelater luminosus]|uniref:PML C-terminal domain-containing protein n=1 Tax=Ignelater luminosus TaxID=2038154 RepID=A0A8K0CRF2_IGNLU|nr:hypothetical protein ILUMI_13939 [Ignelater luminosus]